MGPPPADPPRSHLSTATSDSHCMHVSAETVLRRATTPSMSMVSLPGARGAGREKKKGRGGEAEE